MALPLAAVAGVLLDRMFGEVSRWHPLVGFGRLAVGLEQRLNRGRARRAQGLGAWALAVLPWVALAAWLRGPGLVGWLLDVGLLYLALGGRSLAEHAAAGTVPVGTDAGSTQARGAGPWPARAGPRTYALQRKWWTRAYQAT